MRCVALRRGIRCERTLTGDGFSKCQHTSSVISERMRANLTAVRKNNTDTEVLEIENNTSWMDLFYDLHHSVTATP